MAAMISVDDAQSAIREALSPLLAETVPLEAADGRALAEPVVARMSQPPFRASAMDGYAIRLSDAREAGARLHVIGVSSAGRGYNEPMPPGTAVRIYTGSPVPAYADHVIVQEETAPDDGAIVVTKAQIRAQNIRLEGADFLEGETLLAAGTALSPTALALVAAGNVDSVSVTRRPRVAILANGDELVAPGESPGPDRIICSIPFGLAPLIQRWGAETIFLGVASDTMESIKTLARQAADCDLIVPIGGASVGDRDFMRRAFADLGYAPVFEKVSVKPGKPSWFATSPTSAALGLPGNPASAFVMARLLLKPAIERLLGLRDESAPVFARTMSELAAPGLRETYLRARIEDSDEGMRIVTAFADQDSSLLSVMARANALIRRDAHAPSAARGSLVRCILI